MRGLNPPEQNPGRGEFRREYAGEELVTIGPRKTKAHRCEASKNEYFTEPTEHSGFHSRSRPLVPEGCNSLNLAPANRNYVFKPCPPSS